MLGLGDAQHGHQSRRLPDNEISPAVPQWNLHVFTPVYANASMMDVRAALRAGMAALMSATTATAAKVSSTEAESWRVF